MDELIGVGERVKKVSAGAGKEAIGTVYLRFKDVDSIAIYYLVVIDTDLIAAFGGDTQTFPDHEIAKAD